MSVDSLAVGSYNYTIRVLDIGGNSASDTVFVFVLDGTIPTIDSPADISYVEGETGNSITWNPSDPHPLGYEIFRDGVLAKSGAWNSSGETISISVDGLTPGDYNYTISIADLGNNIVVDQINVAVTSPTTTTSLPTQTTTSSPPLPAEQRMLSVLLIWFGFGIIFLLIAKGYLRRTR